MKQQKLNDKEFTIQKQKQSMFDVENDHSEVHLMGRGESNSMIKNQDGVEIYTSRQVNSLNL